MSIVSDIEIRLRADIARLQADMTQARQAVSNTMDRIRAMAGGAANALAAIGGALAVGAFAAWIKTAIDAVDAIGDISPATGVAIEDIAGLQMAFQFGGLEAAEFEKTMIKLSGAIASEDEAIAKLGVAMRDAGGEMRRSKDVLYDLADQFAKMEDGTKKTALAVEVFGKSGAALIPMLSAGSEGLREMAANAEILGLTFTKEGVEAAGEFNDSLDTLGLASQGVARQLAQQMLPALNDIAGSFIKTIKEGDGVARTAQVIGYAFKGLYTAGVIIVELFKTIGSAIGTTVGLITGGFSTMSKVLKLFIEGEYSQAWSVATTEGAAHAAAVKGMAVDVVKSWGSAGAAISDTWTGAGSDTMDALNAQSKAMKEAKKSAEEAKKAADEAAKAQAKLEAEKAKRDEADAREAQRMADAYAAMVLSIEDRIDATAREAAGLKPLTESQQLSRDLDRQLLSGKTVLTAEQIRYYRALITTLGVQEEAADANKQAIQDAKALADAQKEISDAEIEKQKDLWGDIEKTAHDTFVSITEGGKGAAQRLRDTFKNIFFDWLYQMTLKKWIIQLQPSVAGGGGLLETAQKAFGNSGGGITGMVQAGKTIYEGFAKSMSSSLGGIVSKAGEMFGSKAASTMGANMSSSASAGPIAGAIIAGMMANNKFFDEGWKLNASDIIKSQMSSMFKGNGFAPIISVMTASMNIFEKAAKGLGINAKFASMLSGSSVFARAFGRKAATVESQGLQGTISTSGFDGKAFAEMLSKGGWFRSDKRSTTTQALDGGQDAAFDSTIKSVVDSVRSMGAALGLEASLIDGYSKQIKITLGKDEAENQKLIEAAFGGLADDLSSLMLPAVAQFAQSGETASATMQRVAGNFGMVTAALDIMNTTSERAFGSVGVASLAARERLVELAGGVESLASQTAFFSQNFMTEAERLAPVQRMVSDELGKLGKSGITTAAEFKAAVLDLTTGGKLATEEGARTYAGLLALAPAFKTVTDATSAAAQKLIDDAAALAAEVERATIEERASLQDEWDSLTMTSAQLLEKQRHRTQESNRALYDNITAFKAHQAATNAAAADLVIATQAIEDARVKGIADALDAGDKLIAGAESAYAVLQRVAGEEKARLSEAHNVTMSRLQIEIDAQTDALSKHKALSDALRSTIGSMGGGNPGMERGAAQAQVKMALAMARAGAMPLVETLKDSLSVLSRDSTDLFDSLEDYQRDFYRTQNDLIELAAVSDAALSVDEKQLRALQSTQAKAEEAFKREIAAIDATLVAAQASLDTLRGISTTGLTIVDALNALRLAIVAAQQNNVAGSLAQINQAYQDNLKRAPDAAGLEFWKERIASGVDIKAVVDGIKNSEEAQIRALYTELLGRTADMPGLKFFMDSGASIEGIRAAIIQSEEYRARTAAVYTTQQNTNAAASQASAAAMITELQTLNGRMANVEVAIMNTEQNTRQFATEFNSVSNGGESLFVEAPNYAPV